MTKPTDEVSSQIEKICAYLRNALYETDPDDGRPLTMALTRGVATHGSNMCELCERLFGTDEQVLHAEYDVHDGDVRCASVCMDLKACQQRRQATADAAILEQQKIANLVILPEEECS